MNRKPVLIEALEIAGAEEQQFVRRLSPKEHETAGKPGEWSPKDRLAHIAAWKKRSAEDIRQGLAGNPPTREPDYDFDAENARIQANYAEQSWEAVLELADKASQEMKNLLGELSEEQLSSTGILPRPGEPPLWRVVVGNGFSHPLVHLSEHYSERGDLLQAAELVGLMARQVIELDKGPIWQGTVRYNLACYYALLGQKERAIAELRGALELNTGLVEWSKQDPDLEPLRRMEDYQKLYSEE